jgi:cytochrome P450
VSSVDFGELLRGPEARNDPFSIYRQMRETAPVHWSQAMNAWLVTGYHEVREVYRSHERFSSVGKTARDVQQLAPEIRSLLPSVEQMEMTPALAQADPPTHTKHRALIMRPLTPRRLAAKREWIEEMCRKLTAQMAELDEPDLVTQFSSPLSYGSILTLFGAPLDQVPVYQEATTAHALFLRNRTDPAAAKRYERSVVAMRSALEELYPHLHNDTTIIGALLTPEDSSMELPYDELFVILKTFFAAGHENIIYSIPTAIHLLLQHPDQLALVRDDPSLAAAAYEEAVRYDTPAQANQRVAIVDTELGGQQIRAGDQVLNFKGSANRDPAVWSDPDRFDICRDQSEPSGQTVAFGQGIHFCAGAGLARMEGPVAINALLERFPNLSLPQDWQPCWLPGPIHRKLETLPLSLR